LLQWHFNAKEGEEATGVEAWAKDAEVEGCSGLPEEAEVVTDLAGEIGSRAAGSTVEAHSEVGETAHHLTARVEDFEVETGAVRVGPGGLETSHRKMHHRQQRSRL